LLFGFQRNENSNSTIFSDLSPELRGILLSNETESLVGYSHHFSI